LNGVMAFILRYFFTEFVRFPGALRKNCWRYT